MDLSKLRGGCWRIISPRPSFRLCSRWPRARSCLWPRQRRSGSDGYRCCDRRSALIRSGSCRCSDLWNAAEVHTSRSTVRIVGPRREGGVGVSVTDSGRDPKEHQTAILRQVPAGDARGTKKIPGPAWVWPSSSTSFQDHGGTVWWRVKRGGKHVHLCYCRSDTRPFRPVHREKFPRARLTVRRRT